MVFKDVLNKIMPSPSDVNVERIKSPEEMELQRFQERQRLDQVKEEVIKFRQEDRENMFGGKSLLSNQNSILKADNVVGSRQTVTLLNKDNDSIIRARRIF